MNFSNKAAVEYCTNYIGKRFIINESVVNYSRNNWIRNLSSDKIVCRVTYIGLLISEEAFYCNIFFIRTDNGVRSNNLLLPIEYCNFIEPVEEHSAYTLIDQKVREDFF